MKVIGLTGGIGTGKSTVSAYLKKKNIPVIDADAIAHQLTAKGSPLLAQIRTLLGEEVFTPDGSMLRQRVADMIFHDPQLLAEYEALVTAAVVRESRRQIAAYRQQERAPLVVVDAPLLFESGLDAFTDEDWLVNADLPVRLARVQKRDGLSEEEILDRIRHQMSADEKAARADHVLDNSGDLHRLYSQIDSLLGKDLG